MKYAILEADDAGELRDRVQRAINEGWTLQGGVSGFFGAYSKHYYMQAIIKIDNQ